MGELETGRRRRYYRLTKHGRAQMEAQRQQWEVVEATLHEVWKDTLERIVQTGLTPSIAGSWGTT